MDLIACQLELRGACIQRLVAWAHRIRRLEASMGVSQPTYTYVPYNTRRHDPNNPDATPSASAMDGRY